MIINESKERGSLNDNERQVCRRRRDVMME
jgi:hypothetical protein